MREEKRDLREVRARGLSSKVLAAEYKTTLPDEKLLATELANARRVLESKAGKR